MKIVYITLALIIVFTKHSPSQDNSGQINEILQLKDERRADEILFQYLHSLDPEIRKQALYSLANIADSTTVSQLNFLTAGPYTGYPVPQDFEAMAFMLSQIPSDESRSMLDLMIRSTEASGSRDYFIKALGSVGNAGNLEALISQSSTLSSSSNSAIAKAIAGFALRKIKSKEAVELLKRMQEASKKENDIEALRDIAFAYWRIGDKDLLLPVTQEIFDLIKSEDPQTRMWGYNALGKLQDENLLLYVLETMDREQDWRVKVNMMNSITNFNMDSIPHLTEKIIDLLGGYRKGENENISVTRLNVLGKLFAGKKINKPDDVMDGLADIMNSEEYGPAVKKEAAVTLALIFKDSAKADLMNTLVTTSDYELKSAIVGAFGSFDDPMIYKELRDTISAEVRRYVNKYPTTIVDMIGSPELGKMYRSFVKTLTEFDDRLDEENRNTVRLIYTEFAGSKDPSIIDLSLTALNDTMYSKYKFETSTVMGLDYKDLQLPKDIDAMLAYIYAFGEMEDENSLSLLEENLRSDNYEIAKASAEAMEKITGNKYQYSATPRTDYDWGYLKELPKKKNIAIITNKGRINIELLPEAAPFTVMNFLKLSEKNYFDDLMFHRVVPNFVIQGGDPAGTGYGGPGYSIRSEFSQIPFTEGIVGMASSGKDTEGSQFFITHSATPHLDGKYTVFGKVTEGMDVVDKIMVGDYIEDIVLIP